MIVWGFDKDGFDREGYTRNGEYKECIFAYIKKNTNIDISSSSGKLLLTEDLKNITLNIDRAQKSLDSRDYVASLSHLRRSGEHFVKEILKSENLELSIRNSQLENLDILTNNNLLTAEQVKRLHEIRITGNSAVNEGIGDIEHAETLLKEFREMIHNWLKDK